MRGVVLDCQKFVVDRPPTGTISIKAGSAAEGGWNG